jgi:hypothetical protein
MLQPASSSVTLLLAGDVMTGRAIERVLPHSLHSHFYEHDRDFGGNEAGTGRAGGGGLARSRPHHSAKGTNMELQVTREKLHEIVGPRLPEHYHRS